MAGKTFKKFHRQSLEWFVFMVSLSVFVAGSIYAGFLWADPVPQVPVQDVKTVCVMMPECEGLTVTGENPLYIPSGEDAVFPVSLSEQYRIARLEEGAAFDGEAITIRGVRYPHTVDITTAGWQDTLSVGRLTYHANGGTVAGEETLTVEFKDDFWLCPNTPVSDGSFTREGHILLGFGTEQEGGTYYGTGWNVPLASPDMELWAVWAEETPLSAFTWEIRNGEATIRGYEGDFAIVAIPAEVDGCPVTKIAGGAFRKASLTTLVLGENVKTVQEEAFQGCESLETLYLTDNVTHLPDNAFGDASIQNLYVNGAREPVFSYPLMGMGSVKMERLLLAPSPKLALVAGSSCLFGISTPLLEEELDHRYTVINLGNHAGGTPSAFFMELASAFLEEGDILLTAPEPDAQQWGGTTFTVTLWQIFESAYEAFSHVDIRGYSQVFSSFAAYNRTCLALPSKGYGYRLEGYSNTGDYDLERPNARESYIAGRANAIEFKTAYQHTANIAAYNRQADWAAEKGIRVLLSFSPVNYNALTKAARSVAQQTAYRDRAEKEYHAAVISEVGDYIMNGQYFYDTDLHLTTEGAQIRTKQLAEDIRAWLESKGGNP